MNILRNRVLEPYRSVDTGRPLGFEWRAFIGQRPETAAGPIVRLWHGRTPRERADAYVRYLEGTGVQDLRATPGNRAVRVLCGVADNTAHFLVLSWWKSESAIQAFAGDDIGRARYYPEDARYLLEMDERLHHLTEVIHRA